MKPVVAGGMAGKEPQPAVRRFWRAVRTRWRLVFVCLLIGLAAGAAYISTTKPVYRSTLSFYVVAETPPGAEPHAGTQFVMDRIETYRALLSSERLARVVLAKTKLRVSPDDVRKMVSATAELGSVIIDVRVDDESPGQSLAVATGLASSFGPLVDELDNQGYAPVAHVEVLAAPHLQPLPVSPNKYRDIGLAALAGAMLGFVLVAARLALDTTVESVEDLQRVLAGPVLGVIPVDESLALSMPRRARVHQGQETFRQLRTNLLFLQSSQPLRTIAVTSAADDEGRSFVTGRLGVAYAQAGVRVLILEADPRERETDGPVADQGPGLTDVVLGLATASESTQRTKIDGLFLMAAGRAPVNWPELLSRSTARSLVDALSRDFDLVVIDTPPFLTFNAAAWLSTACDGVLLVARHGQTSRNQVAAVVQSLQGTGTRLLGGVLNACPQDDDAFIKDFTMAAR